MDRDAALRIERNRSAATRWYVARHRALFPDDGASLIEVAGGVAGWPSPWGSPSMGKAIGVALDGTELTTSDLDRIEAFYASVGAKTKLSLCPFTHASAFARMAERGYVLGDRFNVLSRSLSDSFPTPKLAVEAATDYHAWAALVREGMREAPGDERRAETIAVVLGGAPRMHTFIATIDGEPAGGAGLLIDEGVASLFATSTLAAHRRKGVQGSLVAARLAYAKARGCDVAVAMTDVGGDSQRNLERYGFRVGYTATVFTASER